MGMFDRGEIMGWCFLIMGLASCTGSIARVWCSFYWPFFLDYSLLAFSKASANGNLFMGEGGIAWKGWIQEVFSSDIEILFYLNFKLLCRDDQTWRHNRTPRSNSNSNLKFIQLIVVNKLFPTLWFSGPKISKRDNATTTQDQRD